MFSKLVLFSFNFRSLLILFFSIQLCEVYSICLNRFVTRFPLLVFVLGYTKLQFNKNVILYAVPPAYYAHLLLFTMPFLDILLMLPSVFLVEPYFVWMCDRTTRQLLDIQNMFATMGGWALFCLVLVRTTRQLLDTVVTGCWLLWIFRD